MQPVSAAILAGGQSSRMGRDKALIQLNGKQVIQRVVDVVSVIGDDMRIIGNDPEYGQTGVAVISDDVPGSGPLGGIATALRHARHDFVLVVACDMPLLSVPLLRAMAGEPRTFDVLVPRLKRGGGTVRFEPLHAIYGKTCLPVIESMLSSGNVRIQSIFEQVATRALDEDWLRLYDPELDTFINMNTPADLQRAEERLNAVRRS